MRVDEIRASTRQHMQATFAFNSIYKNKNRSCCGVVRVVVKVFVVEAVVMVVGCECVVVVADVAGE